VPQKDSEIYMKINKQRLKYEIQENFVDATSIVTLTMPINSALELFGANMSNDVSINSRVYNLGLMYGGLSRLVKLRDYTKRKLNIDNYSGLVRAAHDAVYGFTIGPLIKTRVYLAAGETDWKKIGIGVLGTMAIVGTLAIPLGWMVDVGRDLWGIKPSVRTPKILKEKSSRYKKAAVYGALSLSIGLTSLIYLSNHYRTKENAKPLEQVVQQDNYSSQQFF
jgi:hypothetical protein